MEKYLSEAYDLDAVFNEQVRPLLERVHDICVQHKIPFVAMAATKNTPGSAIEMESMCNLVGEERTPLEFCVAEAAPQGRQKMAERLAILTILRTSGCDCPECTAKRERNGGAVH